MSVTLSQNEIRARAARFAETYKDAVREEEDAQSFQNDFFQVLGIARRRVATFEKKVKCRDGSNGYIDLFWKGHILIEMKSLGKDREKAYQQAKRYADTLKPHELPRAILICDFQHWDFYDLDKGGEKTSFTLEQLPEHICLFHYLAGYEKREYVEEDPVNVQAAELLGKFHDALKESGYCGHALEVYLVRLLFCLFAEDTGIFERDSFHGYLSSCTAEDGRDLAPLLAEFFQVLNTPEKERMKGRNEILLKFPYINGGLFAELLPMPAFDTAMRQTLLDCCGLDWGKISPAIFGSMFQSVMKPEERRALGAHYTSERNILKLINPLFMDGLKEEFNSIQADKSSRKATRLKEFHKKLGSLRFLDPACGCGNFLVVAYRELRMLELQVIREMEGMGEHSQWLLSVNDMCLVNVNQFYGIEIEEFPAQIAQVALWLMDHQMNIQVGRHFGKPYVRIPLKASATIVCGNALRLDWAEVVPEEKLDYILGNPPFVGYTYQTVEQKEDMKRLFGKARAGGKLDFVAAWYRMAAQMMQSTPAIKTAFVSTNSITQGEQASTLWKPLMEELNIHIDFACRTFKWSNEGRNKAAVHCVIVGFSTAGQGQRLIYDSEGNAIPAKHINSYLMDAPCVFIEGRNKPLCDVPEMTTGNRPADGGHLIIEEKDYADFVGREPGAKKYIRRLLGSEEFIKGKKRYCLWLAGASPSELRTMPSVMERIEGCRAMRLKSTKEATRASAATPALFQEIRQPGVSPAELRSMPLVMERIEKCRQDRLASPDAGRRKLATTPGLFRETRNPASFIVVPEVSSERRQYVPIGFLDASTVPTNKLYIIPEATLWHFGVLTSRMHMAWMRAVAGRLKSDYQYSGSIVYNTFPWPEATEEQKAAIGKLAQSVLNARAMYPDSSLADLYDPCAMPPELAQAHRRLDAAVEKLYRKEPFADDAGRVAYLFERYRELTERENGRA